MDEPINSEQRKTISLTHRQLGWGGGIVASLALVSQLKGNFFTREEGISQAQQLTDVRFEIASLKADMTTKIERATDKIVDRIKESEDRSTKNADRVERRVDALELASRGLKANKSNN